MNYRIYILLFVFFSSCKTENDRIKSFNQKLSQNDKLALNALVLFYEDILEANYLDSADPVQSALNDIVGNNANSWKYDKAELCRILYNFENSTLQLKGERLKYDTVFVGLPKHFNNSNDSMLIMVTQDGDTTEAIFSNPTLTEDAEEAREDGYWSLIHTSSFVNALKHGDAPDEINGYIERSELVGSWNHRTMAKAMIADSMLDYEDYFIKRIIVFEIMYEHLKNEHGC